MYDRQHDQIKGLGESLEKLTDDYGITTKLSIIFQPRSLSTYKDIKFSILLYCKETLCIELATFDKAASFLQNQIQLCENAAREAVKARTK